MAATSLTATGSAYEYKNPEDALTVVQLSGTYGTVTGVFEGCLERPASSSSNWFPVAAIRFDTGALVNGSIALSDNSEVAYSVPSPGLSGVRFRVTAIASGTITVTSSSMPFKGSPFQSIASTGDAYAGDLTLTGGASWPDSAKAEFGDAADITMAWDGTDFDILQATANSSIKVGVDGAGMDIVLYGDTASTNVTWDQSADEMIFTGQAYLSGPKKKTVANTDGSITIDATHSGKMITTRGAGGATTVTLPTVAAGFTGVHFHVFNCVDQDLTLSAQTAGEIMFKNDLAANSVAFSTAGEKIGAAAFVMCDGTSWLVMPLAEEATTITVAT